MVNDPIADMLIQIKNASMAGRSSITLPNSKLKLKVAEILSREGYVGAVAVIGEHPRQQLTIAIRYKNKKSVISEVKKKSKPGLRKYVDKNAIPTVLGGIGTAIVSTSSGIMTGREAKKLGLGGELLCEIW